MSVEILGRVAGAAARDGIMRGPEVVNRCVRADRPAERDSPPAPLCHMNIEESDVMTAIRETGAHLGDVHGGDPHRGHLGSGSIDFAEVFRAPVCSGRAGPSPRECFSSRAIGQPLEAILASGRKLREDGRDPASHALRCARARPRSMREALRQAGRGRLP
ncbi:hypothetical protein [Burkholderia plantarii]|nr:hypothetical protein [Burkholderia plantarii]